MKKIISLIVAAMMIMSLFAVNVGAVVTHGTVDTPWLSENFDGEVHSYWTTNLTGNGTTVHDGGKLILTDGGQAHSVWDADHMDFPSKKYTASFDVVAVNPTRNFSVVFKGSDKRFYAARIYGYFFEKGASYKFKVTVDETASASADMVKVVYSKDGGEWVSMKECGHTWEYPGQTSGGLNAPTIVTDADGHTNWEYRSMNNQEGTTGFCSM